MQKEGYVLEKKDLHSFLNKLKKITTLIAPVKRDILRFEKIKDTSEISLQGITWFSPKKFIFPNNQTILSVIKNKISYPKTNTKPTAIFGIRLCDSNALYLNDHLFKDLPSYKQARENTYLIALYCTKQVDEFCFCSSMELKDYYDLILIERSKHYHIKTGSEKGKSLLKKLKIKKTENYKPQKTRCTKTLSTKDISTIKNHELWKKMGSDRCVSCEQCTNLCPTCLCFRITDTISQEPKTAKRILEWDSCQNRDFTRVSGDFIFREPRTERFMHRIYHKIVYFKESFNEYMCTGCGRCIRGCENKIDWIRIINKIKNGN